MIYILFLIWGITVGFCIGLTLIIYWDNKYLDPILLEINNQQKESTMNHALTFYGDVLHGYFVNLDLICEEILSGDHWVNAKELELLTRKKRLQEKLESWLEKINEENCDTELLFVEGQELMLDLINLRQDIINIA